MIFWSENAEEKEEVITKGCKSEKLRKITPDMQDDKETREAEIILSKKGEGKKFYNSKTLILRKKIKEAMTMITGIMNKYIDKICNSVTSADFGNK